MKSSGTGELITASVKGGLKDVLTQIDLDAITFVSDLTFLIKNVNKWYVKHGNLIRAPHLSAFSENIKGGAPYFNQPDAYQEQQNATLMALSEPVSYVWGPPGTGKTQYVLADCIINHIQKNQKVIVCAPTNNALEQTLRAVISALEKLGEPIDCLYRCGTSSEGFAKEYGKICEHLSTQQKIDELKNEIERLKVDQKRTNIWANIAMWAKAEHVYHNLIVSLIQGPSKSKKSTSTRKAQPRTSRVMISSSKSVKIRKMLQAIKHHQAVKE